MSNSFNISVKPEIAALSALVQDNQTEIAGIRGADLIALTDEIDANEALLDLILDPGIVNLASAIANNSTDIATVDGIVDSILEDTAALPQNVRGKSYSAQLSTAESAFQVVCDVTGHGIIRHIAIQCDAADNIQIKITLDDTVLELYTYPGNGGVVVFNYCWPTAPSASTNQLQAGPATTEPNFNIEYDSGFKIEIRRSSGTTADVHCKVYYNLDGF